jgi:TRAP-type mannitol/chloroaromatic compound transport system permease small subunit
MTSSAAEPLIEDVGEPALFVRIFGWTNIALMMAFTILAFWFKWPGVATLYEGGAGSSALAAVQGALYVVLVAAAFYYVLTTRDRTLRHDSRIVSDANAFFIRAAFWAVFLIGLADTTVSAIRAEGGLEGLFGDHLAVQLGISSFRGEWIHVPALLIGVVIAVFTRTLGFFWLALLVVLAELLIVLCRFIFSYEQPYMADLVRFWYAALFLFASAYTLKEDGHVRVDVLYANFRGRTRGRVNAIGSVMLGMTLCWTILFVGMWTKSSIIVSPILVFETTQTGFGLYVKYFMAGFLGVYAVSMMVQFVSYMFESVADWRGEPGGRAEQESVHVG